MTEMNTKPEGVLDDEFAPQGQGEGQPVAPQGQPTVPQPGQAQPQAPSQPPAGVPTSGLGIAGLVLGILAVPPAFIPVLNFLTLPLAIVGVILAAIGLSGIKKGKAKGKGIAMAGLVLGIVAIGIFIIMYGSAAAVSGTDTSSQSSSTTQESAQSADSKESSQESGQESSQDADAGKAEESGSEDAEYKVKIADAKLSKDYSGDAVIIVTYKWENNSDDKTSFASALYPKCYQDGVQLETAISDEADSDGYLAEVKPGHGTTVEIAYELKNKKDDVEVEVGPLISFDDKVYASKTFSIK